MKSHLNHLLLAATALLTACAAEPSAGSGHHRNAANRESRQERERREDAEDRRSHRDEPIGREPRIGMTKGQVIEMYGEPSSRSHSARGEVWSYWFNRGHAFIPYNFGYTARTGTFIFGANGRLQDFNYNE